MPLPLDTDKKQNSEQEQIQASGSARGFFVLSEKKSVWIIVFFVFAACALFLVSVIHSSLRPAASETYAEREEKTEAAESELRDNVVSRLLDGVWVEPADFSAPIIAVTIDNHRDAWPQAGLSDARLVIESEAEGGMTRYLAFFNADQEIARIGPVRSSRPYTIDWAAEWSALYAHVGGSPAALAKLVQDDILDINEFYNERYFWRDKPRYAPHNVFTSTALLAEYLERRNIEDSPALPWLYREDSLPAERPENSIIRIGYKLKGYDVKWEYRPDENHYLRFVGGQAHQDESGQALKARNLVIMVVPARELDELLRLEMGHIGTGEARVCREGDCREAVWKKTKKSARLRFYDNDDNELELLRGNTWIQVVRPEIRYTIE